MGVVDFGVEGISLTANDDQRLAETAYDTYRDLATTICAIGSRFSHGRSQAKATPKEPNQ